MSDNIQFRDVQVGVAMAWHKKTVVVDRINKANCGIIFPMALQHLHLPNGNETKYKIAVSLDDGSPVGYPVSERYSLITNEQVWDAAESAISQKGCEIVSCGTINDREKYFISIQFEKEFLAAGRATMPMLNILGGHGGAINVHAKTGFTTVVCENTYNMAMGAHGDFSFAIKHVGDADISLLNMEEAIHAHYRSINEFTEAMDKMSNQKMSDREAAQFFAGFVIAKPSDSEPPAPQSEKKISLLRGLFNHGLGNQGENRADAFNAITDLYTHGDPDSKKDGWSRYESSEFGVNSLRKLEGFQILAGEKTRRLGGYKNCIERGKEVMTWVN